MNSTRRGFVGGLFGLLGLGGAAKAKSTWTRGVVAEPAAYRRLLRAMKAQVANPSAVIDFSKIGDVQPLPEAEIDRIRAEFQNGWRGPR